jgi:aryl-alcohol dehydrogenase-like predicted oxidoreductase
LYVIVIQHLLSSTMRRCTLSRAVIALLISLPANVAFTEHAIGSNTYPIRHNDIHILQYRKRRRQQIRALQGTKAAPEPSTQDNPQQKPTYSNFWYSVVPKEEDVSVDRVPCVRDLDKEGPLPAGAYLPHSDPESSPQPICRLTIAVDLTYGLDKKAGDSDMEPSKVVASMQKFLDAGMASFQLKTSSSSRRGSTNTGAPSGLQEWGEEEIFGRLRRETPAFALRNCHLVVPLHIPGPDAVGTVTPSSIRQTVLSSLARTGGDSIDTVQLLPNPYSPYALDVLDCLQDLKREGYVRSVAGKSLDWRLIREAHRCAFTIDSNQVDGNLLDPIDFDNPEQRLACEDLGTKLLVAGPLAGGLLSGRHYVESQEGRRRRRRGSRQLSPSQEMEEARARRNRPLFNPSESRHLETTLVQWGERHGQQDSDDLLSAGRWKLFQSKVLQTMHEIAQKHEVSVSTVALRWTLQTQHVAATVVSCRLLSSEDVNPQVLRDRPKQLRQVFQLHLDDEDMERLWEVSGRLAPEPYDGDRDDEEELYMKMMESKKGLFLPPSNRRQQKSPDQSNRALWL